jgi:hypothetical protein
MNAFAKNEIDDLEARFGPADAGHTAGYHDERQHRRRLGLTGAAEQLPLFPPLPPAEPYPTDALGPVLSRAARAIGAKVQVPEAIAAQSVLAAAALAAQAHADVRLPYGQSRPLSLYFMTIAGSGDRKTTSDREALWPIVKREQALHEIHQDQRQAWAIASAAWGAEKRKIEGDRKLDFESRKLALVMLGPEPEAPIRPLLVVPDPTYEGLVKAMPTTPAALGIFSAEGGQFIGGHGMAQDSKLRTAAGYSELWDGQPIKRVRALDGVSILRGRRLSMHLMVQPEASSLFLADAVLRDQGLLSRVLVAAPDSIAGTRRYREPRAEDEMAIRAYGARILSLLEAPWPVAQDRLQGLEPPALSLSAGAARCWREFYDTVEGQCGANGKYRGVRDLAAKIAEHAARIAGVLAIVDDASTDAIGDASMASAVILSEWYLNEAARLQQACRTDPTLLRAQALLDWLVTRDASEARFADILRLGPSATRIKKDAEAAIEVLKSHGWADEVSSRPRVIRALGPEVEQ